MNRLRDGQPAARPDVRTAPATPRPIASRDTIAGVGPVPNRGNGAIAVAPVDP
jgi:hypothetical protein